MQLLLDTCVWGGAVEALRRSGHDVIWTGNWPEDPGDGAILRYAFEQRRILVTLDKDFGERAIVRGEPHAGIMRLVGVAARSQTDSIIEALNRYGAELQHGGIVTIGARKIRIRPGDAEPAD